MRTETVFLFSILVAFGAFCWFAKDILFGIGFH